ncbi:MULTISPECIES: serine/threonine-protein kinase [Dyella]|uniref:Serine/threonine protein kinase n=2 Tax=Dyella TaxID=231454 RepID=A0A4R0YSE0_9GAMM|nr:MULTISPECIES: serine/threonine-protein kinase [Dyella]TBR36942.1 serine/threonine protein kinase [Dyella terrae]TCI07967.1 serine/threonine protein kinase [Dyella soli]
MTRELTDRYLRAKAIAMAAADMSPEDREAHIAGETAGDDALLREVRWMLAALEDSQATGLPRMAIASPDLTGHDTTAAAPRHYRVLRKLGEGGMGVVYLAERSDGGFVQQVALKVLSAASEGSPILAERFARERQLLARLDHPGIARLVDGGVLEGDKPFLAMEYVEGERIDVWCDAQHLDLRARIELFLKVCGAVEYAHRNLIIHRDIKPANILVNALGEPKLLDFGIARIVDAAPDVAMTQTGQHALTLAYASPEQIEHQPLTTAADVYSLGVVLYQLVAGRRPFQHLSTPHQLSNAIVSGEIVPPGKLAAQLATAAGKRATSLPADIDAIVLKAMRRQASERYATVGEFVADLQRWQEHRPVLAQRGRALYRFRRFAQRNRWSLAAVSVLVIVILVALFASLNALQQARRARGLAESRQHELERMVQFQQSMFESVDIEAMGHAVSHAQERQLIDKLKADPSFTPVMATRLTEAFQGLPSSAMARDALDTYVISHALTSLDEAFPNAPLPAADLRQSLAKVLMTIGSYEHATRELRKVLVARETRLPPGDVATIAARVDLAQSLMRQGQLTEAMRIASRARDDAQALPLNTSLRVDAEAARARLLTEEGKLQEALQVQDALLAQFQSRLPADHPSMLHLRADRIATLMDLGQRDRARDELEPLVASYKRTFGPEHRDTLDAMVSLAELLHFQDNEYERSLALANDVLAVRERRLGADHPSTLQAAGIAAANMVRLAHGKDELAQAHARLQSVIDLRTRVLGAEHPQTLQAMTDMVRLLAKEDANAQAIELQRVILAAREHRLGTDHPDTLFARASLSSLLIRTGQFAEARKLADAVLASQRRQFGPDYYHNFGVLDLIGRIESAAGHWPAARDAHMEALAGRDRTLGRGDAHTVESATRSYAALMHCGEPARAEEVRKTYLAGLIDTDPSTLNASMQSVREEAQETLADFSR